MTGTSNVNWVIGTVPPEITFYKTAGMQYKILLSTFCNHIDRDTNQS